MERCRAPAGGSRQRAYQTVAHVRRLRLWLTGRAVWLTSVAPALSLGGGHAGPVIWGTHLHSSTASASATSFTAR